MAAQFDLTVYEIIGHDRRRVVGGIWLTLETCQAMADSLNGYAEVHPVPVNDAPAP